MSCFVTRGQVTALLVGVCAALLLPAQAQTPPVAREPKDVFQSCYDAMNKAAVARDMRAYSARIAPDCVYLYPNNQTTTFADERSSVQTMFDTAVDLIARSQVEAVSVKGNGATVTAKSEMSYQLPRAGGMRSQVRVRGTSRDFWIKQQGQWKLKRSRVLEMFSEVDGKPVEVKL